MEKTSQPGEVRGIPLGRYVLGHRLAIGGMGEVYLAVQLGLGRFQKPLALKLLLPHLSDSPQAVQMFLDEAQLAARMNHPNVIQIFDVGVAEGRHYIAMELVRGVSMSALIAALKNAGERVSPAALAYVGRALCDGLHHAHELVDTDGNRLQVVHRDVTPHNVLLSLEGDVKLTDFGIAKARDSATHTRPGYVKGKFEYIAPEQLLGKPLDRRVDIFGAGLTLYHLATLNSPFRRENELATLHAIEREPLPALSMLRPDLPRPIREAITKAAAKDPAQRFATARGFRDALPPAPPEGREELANLVRTLCRDALAKLESKTEHVRSIDHPGTSSIEPGEGEQKDAPGHATVSLRGGDSSRQARREPGEGDRTPGFTDSLPASERGEAAAPERSESLPEDTSSGDYPARVEPMPVVVPPPMLRSPEVAVGAKAPDETKLLPPQRAVTDEVPGTNPPPARAQTDENPITIPPPARPRADERPSPPPAAARTADDEDEDDEPPTLPMPAEGKNRASGVRPAQQPQASQSEDDDSIPTRPPPPAGGRASTEPESPSALAAARATPTSNPSTRTQPRPEPNPSGSNRALLTTTGSMRAVGAKPAEPNPSGALRVVGGKADPGTGSLRAVGGKAEGAQSASQRALLANPVATGAFAPPRPLAAGATQVSITHAPRRLVLVGGLVAIAAAGAIIAWLLGLGAPSETSGPPAPSLPTRLEPLPPQPGKGPGKAPGTTVPGGAPPSAGAESGANAARVGFLDVEATPGASVYVSGKKIGETPITRPVEEGLVTVMLLNPENGKSVTRKVKVSAGQHAFVKEDLR